MNDLLRRVGRRDAVAFEQLYFRMLPVVKAFIFAKGWSAAPVDDIVQEVFVQIWTHAERFEARSSASTYILGIALNVIRSFRRSGARAIQMHSDGFAELVAPQEIEMTPLEREDLAQILNTARATLPENQSLAIALIYDDQMAPQDAAESVGCTETAFRSRLRRARSNLHKAIRRLNPVGLYQI
jgi:RNA polymerase sigma-70 factor, ECF subfamily